MKSKSLSSYESLKEKALKDPSVKKAYDELELKYQLIEASIHYRKKFALTQTQFAEMLGVNQQAVSRFEKGKVNPSLIFVSKFLNVVEGKVEFNF